MKVLSVIRDVVVMVGVIVLCGLAFHQHQQAEWERAARMARIGKAINTMTEAYKKAVYEDSDNKGIYHQIFRQNEVLLEYQKLLLTAPFMPVDKSDLALTPPTPTPGN